MRGALVAVLAIAACRSMGGAPENRAYIVRTTPESHTAVAQAVQTAIGGVQVNVDDESLTRSGILVIERSELRDPRPLRDGRDPGDPGPTERFHLVKVGEHCILVHDRTDRHYDLLGTACAPL
jgi:hypothetical protein